MRAHRNEPCPCGSGRRYKHCHGRVAPAAATLAPGAPAAFTPLHPTALHLEAVAAHRAGDLARAEALYRRLLSERSDDAESLHLLGVALFERMRPDEALPFLVDACERTNWGDPVFRQNLGLVLARLLGPQANAEQERIVNAYLARERMRRAAVSVAPCVSVIVATREGAASARAIESIHAQTWADCEIIPVEWRAEEINAAAKRAHGPYLALLGPGDVFAPDRVAAMVGAMARPEPLWGFSWVGPAGDAGDAAWPGLGDGTARAGSIGEASAAAAIRAPRPGDFLGNEPASFGFLQRNVAGADGNLFIARGLFLELGGYRDVDRPGWEFAVRAGRRVEPVVVEQRLYLAGERGHESSRDGTSPDPPAVCRRADELLNDALAGDPAAINPMCPQFPANHDLVLRDALRAGRGDRISIALLQSVAAEWRKGIAARTTLGVRAVATAGDRVAVVVLGVYRSGTSAVARVLNLCGATLPQRLIAPRLALNPAGFWEAEAITDLDVRFLHRLGADWNTLDVALPDRGPIVDEFLATSKEVLAREYGDARVILIKDPRICMLAPLWHRTLAEAGYRPAYLVPVRHPIEVARSFERQGDVRVNGLAVWQGYMQRAEAFAEGVDAPVSHVGYADLLADWRGVVRRIARELDVALDVELRAHEVDRFLTPDLRNHVGDDASLERDLAEMGGTGALSPAQRDAVLALYRRLVGRCARDGRQPR